MPTTTQIFTSGHTAGLGNFGCISSLGPLSSFSYTEQCEYILPTEDVAVITMWDGTTWDPPLLSLTPVVTAPPPTTMPIPTEFFEDGILMTRVQAVALVYEATDKDEGGGDGGDGKDDGKGDRKDDGMGAGKNAASTLKGRNVGSSGCHDR
ncbi:hypothetical protein PT974_05635 [Cladobotryum mycophilum]|uniref:Uncharacterized protein n=1 Tax=Cladobotryum mycophilum TaxID=491253 RepID=A0ABR0SJ97_9HYPO